MDTDDMLSAMERYDASRRRSRKAREDERDRLVRAYEDDIVSHEAEAADVIRLARKALACKVPLKTRASVYRTSWNAPASEGFVVADGITHSVGVVIDHAGPTVRGIGSLGEPSIMYVPGQGVYVSEDCTYGNYGAAGKDLLPDDATPEHRLTMLRAFAHDLPRFIDDFDTYIEDFLASHGEA